jgi:hypothetical protein
MKVQFNEHCGRFENCALAFASAHAAAPAQKPPQTEPLPQEDTKPLLPNVPASGETLRQWLDRK